ncbi:CU044_2847 family protein [Streptantibioticus rubrisoli]|uniref:Trypsin-co-occurring domain-containing protein n=1 Tax=Streptantibioticus rubrisoli TaxID=1387313 RepID=A0ABT1PBU6_9ACTN|nr:CU044_2847 family protein [Streptantibioticus rubrisoli]MCQ4042835.1 hypothetical protein [Streptantibioticus rubrisoli]
MGERVERIELPDGTEVWARLSGPVLADGDDDGGYGDYEDVGALDGVVARVQHLRGLITGVAASVRDAAAQAAPDEVSVEFGVELAVKSGAIVSVLADGESRAALTVTLTWRDRFGREPEPPRPPAAHPRSALDGMPGTVPLPPTPPAP